MGILQRNITKTTIELLESWLDIYISEDKQRGFVATLDLSKIKHDYSYTKFWALKDKEVLLQLSDGSKKPLTNVYLSLNSFEQDKEGKVHRRVKNLAQIRNIGIDLDCYKLGLSADEAIKMLKQLVNQQKIPAPNVLMRSGNGVQLVYGLKGGLPPTEQMKWLTMEVTRQFAEKMIHLGSDFNAISLERVFRLPGTFNVKPDMPKKLVQVELWHDQEYSINELNNYCVPYKPTGRPYKQQKKKGELKPLPLIKTQGNTLRALNTARLGDFLKLIELRGGKIEARNVLTYDYAFTMALTSDKDAVVLNATKQMNYELEDPQTTKEIERTAKNAIRDARAFWKAFEANEYRQHGLSRNLIKPKKNSTLIKHHEITPQEQSELATLIGKEEVYSRKVDKRRKAGVKERSVYLAQCAAKTEDKLERLKQLKLENPKASQRKLAEMMGVSIGLMNKLHKQL